MKLYCTQLPPRDETKQLPNESFNIIQKQVTFNWDDNVDALEFEERLEDSYVLPKNYACQVTDSLN